MFATRQLRPGVASTVFRFTLYLFSAASFPGVTHALSDDRSLAVHFYIRYQELVTHKHVVAVIISIWAFSAFLSLLYLLVFTNISYTVFAISGLVCLVFSAMFYFKIYFAVRRTT